MSEFWRLVTDEFGAAYGRTLVADHVLRELGHRTAARALEDDEPARAVWLALCEEFDVPQSRRWGIDAAASGVSPASNTRSV